MDSTDFLVMLIAAGVTGLIPAFIADRKGGSFLLWWLYGTFLFIVAIPHSILYKPTGGALEKQQREAGMKKCPHCAEWVQPTAKVCRYCSRDLTTPQAPPRSSSQGLGERPMPPIFRHLKPKE